MKVVKRKSKLWKCWKLIFPNAEIEHTYIIFGNTIFTPNGVISEDLLVHEGIHADQQKHSYWYAIWWYVKYIFSDKFRLEQEIPAYGSQIIYLLNGRKDKNLIHNMVRDVSQVLSGGMYNSVGSYDEVYKQLNDYIYEKYINMRGLWQKSKILAKETR